jgi:hypothetical protein
LMPKIEVFTFNEAQLYPVERQPNVREVYET